jgi:hypothetical protein
VEDGPAILKTMTESWGLAPHERYGLWRALAHATWSEAATFREQLIDFYPMSDAQTRAFVETQCHPAHLMTILEALVREGCMTRAAASTIESRILDCPGWGGGWQWETETDTLDLYAVVEKYWP